MPSAFTATDRLSVRRRGGAGMVIPEGRPAAPGALRGPPPREPRRRSFCFPPFFASGTAAKENWGRSCRALEAIRKPATGHTPRAFDSCSPRRSTSGAGPKCTPSLAGEAPESS